WLRCARKSLVVQALGYVPQVAWRLTVPGVRSGFLFSLPTATTEIYTLSLHDALPIFVAMSDGRIVETGSHDELARSNGLYARLRSEEHTSELQSQSNLVCRLLLEKKNPAAASHWIWGAFKMRGSILRELFSLWHARQR